MARACRRWPQLWPCSPAPSRPKPKRPKPKRPKRNRLKRNRSRPNRPPPARPSPARPAPVVQAAQPWARATAPQQQVGAAYVTLTSPAGDRLVGASTPLAASVEIHEMRMDGAVMQMREVTGGLTFRRASPSPFHRAATT